MHGRKHDLVLDRVLRRKFLHNAALAGDQDAVGEIEDFRQIGRDHHNRQPLFGEALDQLVDFCDRADIDATRGFIEITSRGRCTRDLAMTTFC